MTAALEGVSGKQHAPAALYPRERPGTHSTGGWVGLRAGLDGQNISSPLIFDPGPSRNTLYKFVNTQRDGVCQIVIFANIQGVISQNI